MCNHGVLLRNMDSSLRGCSSIGRASVRQTKGNGFESHLLHMGIFDNMRSPNDDKFDRQIIDAAEEHVSECGVTKDSTIWTYGPCWICRICGEGMKKN